MIGRIVGEGISKLEFRTYYSQRINLGEILVVTDEDMGKRLFIRVVDILYGHDAHDENWLKRTAGNMLSLEETGEGYKLHDKEKRLYQLGVSVPLGFVQKGHLAKAKTIPAHLSPVVRPKKEEYEFLKKKLGELRIGLLRSGDAILDIPVGIGKSDLIRHVGIFATTGMGKSNLMRVLSASIMKDGNNGLLLMDPHGEYLKGADRDEGGLSDLNAAQDRMVIFSSNPSTVHNHLQLSASEVEPRDLYQIYNISEAQKDMCWQARDTWGRGWCSTISQMTAEELISQLGENRFNPATVNVVKRRIDHLFSRGIITDNPHNMITPSIMNALLDSKTVLIDTSYLGNKEELLTVSVLARKVLGKMRRLYGDDHDRFKRAPGILITVEEAQRVLGREKNTIFSTIAREGRKFKVGICAISQQPKLINPEVISQLNTLFVLGLADKRDRDILKDSAKQDVGALTKEIQTLGVGEGLVASPSLPFAVPFRVDYFKDVVAQQKEKRDGPGLDDGFF